MGRSFLKRHSTNFTIKINLLLMVNTTQLKKSCMISSVALRVQTIVCVDIKCSEIQHNKIALVCSYIYPYINALNLLLHLFSIHFNQLCPSTLPKELLPYYNTNLLACYLNCSDAMLRSFGHLKQHKICRAKLF